MSVTLEKRRKVAELENFERRILQEKRRLLRELESLEKPFRNTRAMGWIKDFSSDVAGEWRAVQGAASFRAPIWFYVVAGAILLGGVVVATLAMRGAPAPRADGATLRQVETPTTPVRIDQPTPAPATEAAQAADAAPSSALTVSAPPDTIASPTPPTPGSKELKQRLLEAQAATEPLPEPLPPPQKTDVPAAAPALGAATVPPLDAALPKTAFDDAPPVDTAATAEPDDEAPAARTTAARESQREDEPANEGRRAKCFVKVDGRVLFERSCMLRQPRRSTLTLNAGDDAVVLTQDHGRTWTASLGGRSLGKVYRTGECWGRRRQVFICAKGA
ncbi:hypothetical protein IYX23_14150 [Methylocystis sp. L43]|uniref:hypothetical protein n=1 Tax=unclassified Methylocystis TaxID=2625913 RepID=UPI0018C2CF47|nr:MULTISPECIES: hypothetical protein [unclassified Methylocystis]MBG0798813.1 hypothetical protein [Methylocystis sp. L43]MBG0806320.1 hypothetical protein [Methylocystis sp. H15]